MRLDLENEKSIPYFIVLAIPIWLRYGVAGDDG